MEIFVLLKITMKEPDIISCEWSMDDAKKAKKKHQEQFPYDVVKIKTITMKKP